MQLSLALAHNLLTVGQLRSSGYSVLFKNSVCVVSDITSGQTIAVVPTPLNNMFPLNVSSVKINALIAKGVNETQRWHLCYDHLDNNGLKLLNRNNMIVGLP